MAAHSPLPIKVQDVELPVNIPSYHIKMRTASISGNVTSVLVGGVQSQTPVQEQAARTKHLLKGVLTPPMT